MNSDNIGLVIFFLILAGPGLLLVLVAALVLRHRRIEARDQRAHELAKLQARPRHGTLEALAALDWPGNYGRPGERVLLLAAQGWDDVGRRDAAARAKTLAEGCRDDEDALRLLRDFKWNELADLPFPIRDVLGIDGDGRFLERLACTCDD